MRLKYLLFAFLLCCSSVWAQVASFNKPSLLFENTPMGVSSTVHTVTLTNTGSSSLIISSIQIIGAYSQEFSQTNTCGGSLGAGLNCAINVTFLPVGFGVGAASISVTDNAVGSPQRIPLSGTGLHSVILLWTASATAGVTGYTLYRGTTVGGESSTPITSSPVNSLIYIDLTTLPGVTYYYTVTAVAPSGMSVPSNEASAKTPRRRIVVTN